MIPWQFDSDSSTVQQSSPQFFFYCKQNTLCNHTFTLLTAHRFHFLFFFQHSSELKALVVKKWLENMAL
jgi:hypothetical protein